MSTILITGGTGLVGSALCRFLQERGHRVILLSRRKLEQGSAVQVAHWDPARQVIDPEAIAAADHIVNLAGAGVAGRRWSKTRQKEIVESRVNSCALLVKALREIPNKVQSVISMSAVGWYGPDPSIPNPHPFVETDPPNGDFLGETCRAWEAAITPVKDLGKRLVIFRLGIVLSQEGGAYPKFQKPVKKGVAAILGSGKQVLSWIHIDDVCRLIGEAVGQPGLGGVYNAVAPRPIDNQGLIRAIAKTQKRRSLVYIYVPAFVLKLLLGKMSIEVLKSTTVSAEKIKRAGFQFLYPSIESVIDSFLS